MLRDVLSHVLVDSLLADLCDIVLGYYGSTITHERTIIPVDYSHESRCSPDSKLILSGTSGNSVSIHELPTGTLVDQLQGHENSVYSIDIDHTGSLIASSSADNTIRIWDAVPAFRQDCSSPRNALRIFPFDSPVYSLRFSPTDNGVIAIIIAGQIRLIDTMIGDTLSLHVEHHEVWNMCWSFDGEWIAIGTTGGTVMVWDVTTRKWIFNLESQSYIKCICFSPDRTRLISGSEDCMVRIWCTTDPSIDKRSGQCIDTLPHDSVISSISVSPNGSYLVTTCRNGSVRIWLLERDTTSPARVYSLFAVPDLGTPTLISVIENALFSPDGARLVLRSRFGLIYVAVIDPPFSMVDKKRKTVAAVE